MNPYSFFTRLLFSFVAITPVTAIANTITVDSNGDGATGCTLRRAIYNANSNDQTYADCAGGSGADTIDFDPSFFGTPQTIQVTSTLPQMTDAQTTTIDGGNMVTVSGGNAVQVFWVGDLSTKAGAAVFRDIVIADGKGTIFPGGLFMTGSTLQLDHVTFLNNTTSSDGGGLLSQSGTTTINDCIFNGNSATAGLGGGYRFLGGAGITANVSGSTFTGNSASEGGGLFISQGGTVSVANTTFAGNSGYGAAMQDMNATAVTLDYVTIAGSNAATGLGGVLGVAQDGAIAVSNSIIAGNTGPDCNDLAQSGYGLTDAGNNFFGDTSCNGSADGDPKLGPLTDNGGLTMTMAPLGGSPVIDMANCEVDVTTDQRGVARPQGVGCDIGAVEIETIFRDGFEIPPM